MIERALPGSYEWSAWFYADHVSRYVFACDFVKDKLVLDVGTGPGYGASLLSAAGAKSVIGIDACKETLQKAIASYSASNLHFLVDDAQSLSNITPPIDVICSFENIEHLPNPEAFLKNASQKMATDGLMICSTPDRAYTPSFVDGKPANIYHYNEWYRDEFLKILSKYFFEIELKVQVQTFAYIARREAAESLELHLRHLWANPLSRVQRLLMRLFGKQMQWKGFSGLGSPSLSDFPIVAQTTASLIGQPFCHYAICRKPRK